jgi:hypothetical protein
VSHEAQWLSSSLLIIFHVLDVFTQWLLVVSSCVSPFWCMRMILYYCNNLGRLTLFIFEDLNFL